MFGGSKKPYTAVTAQIDRLTSEQYEEDDIGGVFELIEVIRIQSSGPTEAARAIRKKLKYGNAHRQIRALVILDGLIANAGGRFQRTFADEPLLERLRLMARDQAVDDHVRKRCKVLFVQWANAYKATPGLEHIAVLYKQFPKSQRPAAARQKVLQETDPFEAPEDHEPEPAPPVETRPRTVSQAKVSTPSSSSSRPVTLSPTSSSMTTKRSKDKKHRGQAQPFNLAKEKDNMTKAIAMSSIASTNLLNGLQLINREKERVSENQEIVRRFSACKSLRRQILHYIQHVETDDWIGSLVNANDDLVNALTAYEIMDRSIDDDSDSDAWEEPSGSKPIDTVPAAHEQLAGLSISPAAEAAPPPKPPRPAPPPAAIPMPSRPTFAVTPAADASPEHSDEEEDPFGDSNAVATPAIERGGMTWKEV